MIPELDHKIPVSRGGADTLENLVFACRRCNQRKSMRTEAEFRASPDDAITHLRCSPMAIDLFMDIEECYPWVHPEASAGTQATD